MNEDRSKQRTGRTFKRRNTELRTVGRGYRNTADFRIAILFFHGDLDLLPHK
jgi:hypothetical protein